MGCNQSTTKDKQEDRQRTQPANNAGQSTQTQTASKQIGVPNQENEKEPDVSYSQMREMDNDFFKDIIDRTAQKFIDVSTVGPDANNFLGDRDKDYSSQIKETTINKSNILYSLPHLSQSCQPSNLHNLLSQPVPFDNDLMSRCSSSISAAVNNINIKDCGELVVFFNQSLS